jgi:hypothetical protein
MTYIVVAKNGRRLCIRRNLSNAQRVARQAGGCVYTPESLSVKRAMLAMTVAATAAGESMRFMSRAVEGVAGHIQKLAETTTHSINTAQRITAALTYGTPNARSLS